MTVVSVKHRWDTKAEVQLVEGHFQGASLHVLMPLGVINLASIWWPNSYTVVQCFIIYTLQKDIFTALVSA